VSDFELKNQKIIIMKCAAAFLLVLIIASCHNYKKDAENLQVKVDSLVSVSQQKESTIENYLDDFTEIQTSLDSIKKMEELLVIPDEPERADTKNKREQIIADISAISDLLEKNKESIASLKHRLNNASLKSGKLESMVNELETKTKNLEENLKQKTEEIDELSETVNVKNEDITALNKKIEGLSEDLSGKADSLKWMKNELFTGFYIAGELNDLRDKGVVVREGGILGIASTPVVSEDFSNDLFETIDSRELDYLPLNSRKADLISVHPLNSYHISGDNNADTLFIDNRNKFWSISKYLVVAVK